MSRTLKARLWMGSFVALIACLYTLAYNYVGLKYTEKEGAVLIRITEMFMAFQWPIFLVPAFGIWKAIRLKSNEQNAPASFIPEFLIGFALVLILSSNIVWELQKVGDFPKFRRTSDQIQQMLQPRE